MQQSSEEKNSKSESSQSSSEQSSSYTSSDESSTDLGSMKTMEILGTDSINQILNVPLYPGYKIWTAGQIVFSNTSIKPKQWKNVWELLQTMKTMARQNRLPLRMIENNTKQLMYVCLRKKYGGGKILFIDQNVYQQQFYLNLRKLLTVNYQSNEYKIERCQGLPSLVHLKLKDGYQNLKISLQARVGNIIMEKTLDQGEKLYVENAQVIAMSKSIKVTRFLTGGLMLEGKGFVFLQNRIQKNNDKLIMNALAVFLLFLMVLIS